MAGCTCRGSKLEGHWEDKTSQTQLLSFEVGWGGGLVVPSAPCGCDSGRARAPSRCSCPASRRWWVGLLFPPPHVVATRGGQELPAEEAPQLRGGGGPCPAASHVVDPGPLLFTGTSCSKEKQGPGNCPLPLLLALVLPAGAGPAPPAESACACCCACAPAALRPPLQATQHERCELRVTILPDTKSGEHKASAGVQAALWLWWWVGGGEGVGRGGEQRHRRSCCL